MSSVKKANKAKAKKLKGDDQYTYVDCCIFTFKSEGIVTHFLNYAAHRHVKGLYADGLKLMLKVDGKTPKMRVTQLKDWVAAWDRLVQEMNERKDHESGICFGRN